MGIMIGCDILNSTSWTSNYITAYQYNGKIYVTSWSSDHFQSFNSHANIVYI